MADTPFRRFLAQQLLRATIAVRRSMGRTLQFGGLTLYPPPPGPEREKFLEALALLKTLAPRTLRRLERFATGGVRDGLMDAFLHLTRVVTVQVTPTRTVEELAGTLAFQAGHACATARWSAERESAEGRLRLWRAGCGEAERFYLQCAGLHGASTGELHALQEQLRAQRDRGPGAPATPLEVLEQLRARARKEPGAR